MRMDMAASVESMTGSVDLRPAALRRDRRRHADPRDVPHLPALPRGLQRRRPGTVSSKASQRPA